MKKLITLLLLTVLGCNPTTVQPPVRINSIGVADPTELDESSGVNITNYSTASISPDPHSLVILVVGTVNNPARTHPTPTDGLTGNAAWVNEITDTQGFGHISLHYSIMGDNPGSGTVSQTFSGEALRAAFIIFQVTGFDRGTVIRESGVAEENTAVIDTVKFTDLINGTLPVGGILSIGASSITPGTNEVELTEISSGSANEARIQVQYGDGTEDLNFNWSGLNTTGNCGVAIEINSDPGIVLNGARTTIKVLARGGIGPTESVN